MRKKNQPRTLNLDDFLAKVSQNYPRSWLEHRIRTPGDLGEFSLLARLDEPAQINPDNCPLYRRLP